MPTPKEKAYARDYCQRNKEKLLAAQLTPDRLAQKREKYKARYSTDAEYRERIKKANKKWRENHPEQRRQITANQRAKKVAVVQNARANAQCKECGESHPACLDFHHRDPSQKKHRISVMGWRGLRVETMLAELAKCDVLCANCHRKLHWGHKWQIAG